MFFDLIKQDYDQTECSLIAFNIEVWKVEAHIASMSSNFHFALWR